MATMLPPVFGVAFEFDVVLFAQSDNQIKTTPTIAAGDFVISKANGATANLTTLPGESPASSGIVRVQLSATEMEADKLTVKWHDAAGAEWHDGAVCIHTAGQTFDTMDSNIDSILTDTGTTLDALIQDIPTVSEFNARTLVASSYFDPAADAVANVTTVNGLAAGTITAASIATGAIDADSLAADAVTEIQAGLALETTAQSILDDTGTDGVVVSPRAVEGSLDEIEVLRLMLAALVGKATGGGTATITFRDTGDTKDRIILTVDSAGNRSAATLDAS